MKKITLLLVFILLLSFSLGSFVLAKNVDKKINKDKVYSNGYLMSGSPSNMEVRRCEEMRGGEVFCGNGWCFCYIEGIK